MKKILFMIGKGTVSSPNYGISNMSYDNNIFDPGAQLGTTLVSLEITDSYLYLTGATNVYKYNWTDNDLSASVYSNDTFAVVNSIIGISIKSDGSKMIYMRANNDALERTFGTNFTLSTLGSQTLQNLGATFSQSRASVVGNSGNSIYILGDVNDYIYQYDFTSSWGSVSTLTYSGKSFDVAGSIIETNLRSMCISPDGKIIIIGSPGSNLLYQFTMSTAWDLSTLSYDSVTFDISGQVTIITGIRYNNAGDKLIITNGSDYKLHQYSLNN